MDIRLSLVGLFFFLTLANAIAQEESITSYIQSIESNSDYIFNYDVSQTDAFSSKFILNGDYSISQLEAFFRSTPFDIKVDDKRILILPVQKYNFTICGKVMSEAKRPLAFTNVYIGNAQGTTTDESGRFSLDVSSYKNEFCHVSYLGFDRQSFQLADLESCPNIYLKSNDFLISNDFVVVAYMKKGIQEGRSYGGLDLDFRGDRNELTIYNQDIFQTLQQLPGISSPDDSAVNLNIRGGTPDHNLINWEGVTLYDQGYLFGMISSVNPFNIEKVSIYKSNHSPALDNKIGGVVNMYLPDTVPARFSPNIGLNLTEIFGNIHLPIIKNKVSVLVAGRKSLHNLWEHNPTYSSYTQKIFQSERTIDNDEVNEVNEENELKVDFKDFNAKLIVEPNDRLKIQSSLLVSSGENKNVASFNAINLSSSDALSSSSLALSNRLAYRLFRNDSIGIAHTYSRFKQESEVEFSNTSSSLSVLKREESNEIIDQQFRLNYSFGKNNNRSSIGYVYDTKSTKLEFEEYSTAQTEIETYTNTSGTFHHLYATHLFSKNKWLFEFGGRASYSQDLAKTYVSLSFSLRYRLKEYLKLKASAGIYYQFIRQIYEPIDNNLNLENAVWTLDVTKESPVLNARKIAAGAVFNKAGWLIDVEGYYHQTKGLASQNPNIRNSIIVDPNNELVSKGIDFLINKRFKNFNNSIFYSIFKNDFILSIVEEMEIEKERFAANNNQLHNFKWLSSYRIKQLELSLSYHYKSGLPFTDKVSIIEDDEYEEEHELMYESFNNRNLKDYHRVDLAILYSNNWKSKNYEVGLSILNILNRKNLATKKSILTETDDQNMTPEILELTKSLLPFTFNFHARLYW